MTCNDAYADEDAGANEDADADEDAFADEDAPSELIKGEGVFIFFFLNLVFILDIFSHI